MPECERIFLKPTTDYLRVHTRIVLEGEMLPTLILLHLNSVVVASLRFIHGTAC